MSCGGEIGDLIVTLAKGNPKTAFGTLGTVLGAGIGAPMVYWFKARPELKLKQNEDERKQRDEDRTVIDRTKTLSDEFKFLCNLNSSQRNDLFQKMTARSISESDCRAAYRSIRETTTEGLNKVSEICTEYFGASKDFRRRFFRDGVYPYLCDMLTGDVLESVRRTAQGLKETVPVWSKQDLKVLREFSLRNSGYRLPYVWYLLRRFHKWSPK